MASLALALLQSALLASSAEIDFETGVRTEVRARSTGSIPENQTAGDAEIRPSGQVQLSWSRTQFRLQYAPSFILHDSFTRGDWEILHQARLGGEWRAPSNVARVFLLTDWSYGNYQFAAATPLAPIAGTPPTPGLPPVNPDIQPVPLESGFPYLNLTHTAGVEYSPERRLRLQLLGEYFRNGGLSTLARQAIPLQTGAKVGTQGNYALTHRDGLVASLSVTRTRFSTGSNVWLVENLQGWQRQLSRQTQAQLSAGVSALKSSGQVVAGVTTDVWVYYPGAMLTVNHNVPIRDQRLNFYGLAQLGPIIDRLSGSAYQRAELQGNTGYGFAENWHLSAGAGFSRSLSEGPNEGDRVVSASSELTYRFMPQLTALGGFRTSWQRSQAVGPETQFLWVATVALSYQERFHTQP